MEEFLKLAQAAALLSASALCLYLIVVLTRVSDVLQQLQKDLAELSKSLKPVLDNLNIVAERLKSITTKIDDQVGLFKGTLEAFKQVADNIAAFEGRVQSRLEEPFLRVGSLLSSIVSRVASLFNRNAGQTS